MKIPLVDLAAQHAEIAGEIAQGFERVINDTGFVLGDEVGRFESAFAEFSSVRHCIGVANGTDALELCLRALGVGAGDEVIVPTNSFAASALAVVRAGATPVFCDIDADTYLIDPSDAAKRITRSTKAIMPVHLYGQICLMEQIADLATSENLYVVEDAAQAQGASRLGTRAGGFGVAAGTSFYPGKNLGAYGDAGAVLTNSDDVAERVRGLRNYGAKHKYIHSQMGFNSRLDSLQAAVLNVKLKRLTRWNDQRREAAHRYAELLRDTEDILLPSTSSPGEHIWHLFVVRVRDRDTVLRTLNEAGIGAGVHYPVPIHLQPAFGFLGSKAGDLPVAEEIASEILSLPIYPEITEEQQRFVADSLLRALRS